MDDWTLLVKNAVAVLVILLAISVVVFLAYLGFNAANKGGENLSNRVSTLDAKTVDAYNQKTISGATVLAAIQNLMDSDIAILVRTGGDSVVRVYNSNILVASAADPGGNAHTTTIPFTSFGDALNLSGGTLVFTAESGTASAHTISGYITNGLLYPSSKNRMTGPATTSGSLQYINSKDKFRSVLVYDGNKELVGIYMEQIGIPVANNPKL